MRRLPPLAALLIILALCGALAAACGGSATEPDAAPAAATATTTTTPDAIPVEALPDPLPQPYLFRDTVTVEREIPSEVIHVVVPGDTLAGIAGAYCITVEEIQRLNNIVDVASLSVGQELRIPIREGACGVASPQPQTDGGGGDQPEPAAQQRPGEIYVVQPGDTLVDIADAYGFGWRDIADYNNLSEAQAGALQVGQELIIPPESALAPEVEEEPDRTEPPG